MKKKLRMNMKGFNSTMVRLKRKRCFGNFWSYWRFQFHYGAIKTILYFKNIGIITRFNSTMVRLKQEQGLARLDQHKCFNSTMVRLKHQSYMFSKLGTKSFNSTMVRLKLFSEKFGGCTVVRFQFHYGAIKTRTKQAK